jgi:hypothetical protein
MELKWSYDPPGKVFESAWDMVKLVLLGSRHGYSWLFVTTGAAVTEWAASETRDLFDTGGGRHGRRMGPAVGPGRGPNYGRSTGEDVVIGGRGN